MRETTVDGALEEISERFAAGFPAKAPALRTVGREAEFPLVGPDGRAADASLLWPVFLEQGDCSPVYDQGTDGSMLMVGVEAEAFSCVIEVGKTTVELSIGPRPTLHHLAQDMEKALARLQGAVRRCGFRLLGFGIQPRTSAGPQLLTPKRRYAALLEAIGPQWLKFCVTAGDQVQVDMGRDDVVRQMNLINAASGAIIAFTANSSVYGGRAGRFASGREGLAANMVDEPYRHGASPQPFADLEEYVRFLSRLQCLCLPDEDGGFEVVGRPFADHLKGKLPADEPEAMYEAFLFHEHYIWPSARPRARIGTLEIRPACQQPEATTWVPSALALGLVEASDEALSLFDDVLGADYWMTLCGFRELAVRHGLSAPEPVPGFLASLLDLARKGLKQRGNDEDVFLAPAFDLLEGRSEPADHARRLLEAKGMEALIEGLSLT
ncbi:MAG: glutamate-cysteine ligase family protein [Rubrobacteraceae bacterium]